MPLYIYSRYVSIQHTSLQFTISSRVYIDQENKSLNVFLNLTQIDRVHEDGSVDFQNGKTILVDVIMHCTGYINSFVLSLFGYFCETF